MEIDMDVVDAHVQKVKQKFSLTKFRLWFSTVILIILAVPFIRIILRANGTLSTAVATIYWLVITRLGFTVIFYPWNLVVAKSITYSGRLNTACSVLILLTMALVTAKSLLAPADLYRYESDSDGTTLWYSVVASLFWTVLLLGSFLLVPLYVRRMRLLRSKSWTLLSLVVPYVVVMLSTAVLHEWGGDIKWISYSIPLLILLFGVATVADMCSNMNVKFDEAYIMVAGFIPFWLGSVLGRALFTIFNDLGPLGSLFVFGAWKGLIFLFEVLSTMVGKKASRYNDGSVFAFCVIYTGSIYAEFIFQTVEFNSLKFWVLLAFRFLLIVVWQGGFKIDLATWVGEHFSSNWMLLRLVKRLTLSTLGNMPKETAERACLYTTSTAPPDVVLAFIRSRAVVVQQTWVENDVKMAADFQAVASAATTVTADFIWNYFGVGENMIKGTMQYKRGVLLIYAVNIGTLFLAQAIARRQLHSKVGKLKKDMSAAVAKIIALSQSSSNKELLKGVDERRASLQDNLTDAAVTGAGPRDNDDDDDMALNDLQEILSMTEALIPQSESTGEHQHRRSKRGSETGMTFFEIHQGSDSSPRGSFMDQEDEDEDDWACDVVVAADGSSSIVKGGYLKLQCPNTVKYQKRYVVLNDSHQLLYYNNKSEVSGHIRDFKGVLRLADVSQVQRGEEGTNRIGINTKLGMYMLQAYTQTEAAEWHSALKKGCSSATHVRLSSLERGESGEENYTFEFQSNPLASRGRPRRNSVRRSSLGGESGGAEQALPEKKGLLKKKNKFFWEERWFELTKNGTLSWYKKARGREGPEGSPRGSLSLRDVISVEQQLSDSCLVNVDIKGRTYELQADSEGLAAEWSAALVRWVEHSWEPEREEDEGDLLYGGFDEARPLVSVSSTEKLYNESLGRPSMSSDYRDSFRDSFQSCDFKHRASIHDRKLSLMPSNTLSSHAQKKRGRRSSLRMSLIQVKKESDSNNTPITFQERPVMSGQETHGWVKKRGAKSGNAWQRRWVEIVQPGMLLWFTSDTEAAEGPKRAKGSLQMSNILSVDLLPEDNRLFDVNVKGRTYSFQSYSVGEARYWYDVLLAWMEQITQEELSAPPLRLVLKNPGVRGRPQRSGYLLKRGVGSSRWQSRWFVLTAAGGLFWYKNPEESRVSVLKAKGSVQLADVLDLELNTAKPTSFDLFVKGRTYELNAKSEKEARSWIADIFKWVTELDTDLSSSPSDSLLNDESDAIVNVRESVSAATRSSTIDGKKGVGEQQDEEQDTLFLPEMAGVVKKKGEKKGAKWHLRWLELSRTNHGQLAYYKDQSEADSVSRAKGVIVMADVLSVEMTLSTASASTTGCLFDVDVQGRTFQFEADSVASAKKWHMALLSWVEHKLQKQQPVVTTSTASGANRRVKPYRRCSVIKLSKDVFPRIEDDKDNFGTAGRLVDATTNDQSERLLSPTTSSSLLPELPATRRGLLRKQGGSHGVWQERWCEVTTPGLLCWFVSEKDAVASRKAQSGGKGVSKAKGRLFLKDVISVDIAQAKIDGGDVTTFDVDVKGRTYSFQASSSDEARLWAESLSAWATYAYSTQELNMNVDEDSLLIESSQKPSKDRDKGSWKPDATPSTSYIPTVNAFGMQVFEKSGMLKKQGGLFGKAWQARWFVLRDDVFTWYADESAAPPIEASTARPVGVQRVSQAKGALGVHAILSVGTEGCAPCCFDIDIQGRTIKFQAENEEDLAAWLSVLRQNSRYLAEETPAGDEKEDIKRLENVSPLFGAVEESSGGNEENVKVPEPCPEARDCLQEVLLAVEKRVVAEEEEERSRPISSDGLSQADKAEEDPNRRSSAVLLAMKSMAFLPKAWMPNANDVSDSDSSDDDDLSSASGEYEYDSDDQENEGEAQGQGQGQGQSRRGEETGRKELPRPHSSLVGAFATTLSDPDGGGGGDSGGGGGGESRRNVSKRSAGSMRVSGGRTRRGSDAADKVFVKTNANNNEKNDNFLNKLKGNSAGELNREFWKDHKYYLFHVTCFVTLHVLYVTSFVLKENEENAN